MKNYELTLVFFTVFSQMAVGLAVFAAIFGTNSASHAKKVWATVGAVTLLALLVSLLHLGHPLGAPSVLRNLGVAWLSLEGVLGGVFFALAVLTFLKPQGTLLPRLSALAGIAFVITQGLTYAAEAQPAINNGIPMLLFVVTAWILGAAGWQCLKTEKHVSSGLVVGVIVWIASLLVIPTVWTAGGTVMQASASGWTGSALYWGAMALGAVAALAAGKMPKQAYLALVLLLCGSLLGRMVFFGETASAVTFIGNIL